MEIRHRNNKSRKICECESTAQKELGKDGAKNLRARLADLKAVERVSDLKKGNPHPLKGNREGQFALRIVGGKRLVFSPDHGVQEPRSVDGSIDWQRVTSILIEEIGDYHSG
ncbi:MAG: killer suppression protein HigA [Ectothiorhodospiraceae bacterium AqS1]|nr:killer suppression protein HigA [Ectothiorhodospiraceae bacterium AqS1]